MWSNNISSYWEIMISPYATDVWYDQSIPNLTLKEETFAEETFAFSRFFTKFAKVRSGEKVDFVALAKVNSRENSNFRLKNSLEKLSSAVFLFMQNLPSKTKICLNLVESLTF